MIEKSRTALENLGDWFAANGLSLSPTKCKFALINEKLSTAHTNTTLSIYGQNLQKLGMEQTLTTTHLWDTYSLNISTARNT